MKDDLTGAASLAAGTYLPGEGLQQTAAQRAAAGPTSEEKTVSMEVLRDGSFNGEYYHTGDFVDVPDDYVETLTLSGFAIRSDRVEMAASAREAKAQAANAATADADRKAAARGARRSTVVRPMTTADMPGAEPPQQE